MMVILKLNRGIIFENRENRIFCLKNRATSAQIEFTRVVVVVNYKMHVM